MHYWKINISKANNKEDCETDTNLSQWLVNPGTCNQKCMSLEEINIWRYEDNCLWDAGICAKKRMKKKI